MDVDTIEIVIPRTRSKSLAKKIWDARRRGCALDLLPYDILLDGVFPLLYIEDIMALRRVNKMLFIVTHEPIIWKRFLKFMNIPVPPLRPSLQWSGPDADLEVEGLVSRAVSCDDNWRRGVAKVHSWRISYATYAIRDMKLLPGGRYLVASVQHGRRYFLTLHNVDHPKEHFPVARLEIPNKAFNIQARYLRYQKLDGIMIMYFMRSWETPSEENATLDANEYGWKTTIDPPYPLKWSTRVVFAPLDSIEQISKPHLDPTSQEYRDLLKTLPGPPFIEILQYETRAPPSESPFGPPSEIPPAPTTLMPPPIVPAPSVQREFSNPELFSINMRPYAAFLEKPQGWITLFDLTNGNRTKIECQPRPQYQEMADRHVTNSFRVLAQQRQLLVIRTIKDFDGGDQPYDLHSIEQHSIPNEFWGYHPQGPKPVQQFYKSDCLDQVYIENKVAGTFQFNELLQTYGDDHPKLHLPRPDPPPPVSMYMQTRSQRNGLMHFNITPQVVTSIKPDGAPLTHWKHNLDYAVVQSTHLNEDKSVSHILPGTRRSLVYHVPQDDRSDSPKLIKMRRYYNPDFTPNGYVNPMHDQASEPMLRGGRLEKPRLLYRDAVLPDFAAQKLATEGVASIAYDESIGRVCVVSGKDPTNLLIMDLSCAPTRDDRLVRFQRFQDSLDELETRVLAMDID